HLPTASHGPLAPAPPPFQNQSTVKSGNPLLGMAQSIVPFPMARQQRQPPRMGSRGPQEPYLWLIAGKRLSGMARYFVRLLMVQRTRRRLLMESLGRHRLYLLPQAGWD